MKTSDTVHASVGIATTSQQIVNQKHTTGDRAYLVGSETQFASCPLSTRTYAAGPPRATRRFKIRRRTLRDCHGSRFARRSLFTACGYSPRADCVFPIAESVVVAPGGTAPAWAAATVEALSRMSKQNDDRDRHGGDDNQQTHALSHGGAHAENNTQ